VRHWVFALGFLKLSWREIHIEDGHGFFNGGDLPPHRLQLHELPHASFDDLPRASFDDLPGAS
jgi:hypothetical protein